MIQVIQNPKCFTLICLLIPRLLRNAFKENILTAAQLIFRPGQRGEQISSFTAALLFQPPQSLPLLVSTVCGAEWLMISCSVTHQRLSFPAAISKISTNIHTNTHTHRSEGAKCTCRHKCTQKARYSYLHRHTHLPQSLSHTHTYRHIQQKGSFAPTLWTAERDIIWAWPEISLLVCNLRCGFNQKVSMHDRSFCLWEGLSCIYSPGMFDTHYRA